MENIDEKTGFPIFITSDFDEPILYAPARLWSRTPCRTLKIITAFTDCERISTHMIALAEEMKKHRIQKGLSVEIVLGMTRSGLTQKKHGDICRMIGFLRQTREMPKISCRYIVRGPEVHSKVYIWLRHDKILGDVPELAFCGSLNYTMNAFYKRRESVGLCSPTEALRYYQELLPDTVDCFDPALAAKLKKLAGTSLEMVCDSDAREKEFADYDAEKPLDRLDVSLLCADGAETGRGSGVNWGIRKNGTKRDRNQAYIPYNTHDQKEGFFPDRAKPEDENCPMFLVLTKDFGSFHMRMAQAGNKALHSVESNAILGEWLRKRMGVASGELITKKMLEAYGRTFVTFRKYPDGVYLLDF